MKRVSIQINDGSHINVSADRMEIQGDLLTAWLDGNLVAVVEATAVISAHLSERGKEKDGGASRGPVH